MWWDTKKRRNSRTYGTLTWRPSPVLSHDIQITVGMSSTLSSVRW